MADQTATARTRPKVLFLSEVINCNDGIASYCQTLAQGLKERGTDVVLVSGLVRSDERSAGKRRMLEESVAAWHVVDGLKKVPTPGHLRRITRIIKDNGIQVVNVHGLGMLMWGRVLSLLCKTRVVATYHPSVLGTMATVQKAPESSFSVSQRLFLNAFFPDALVIMSEESRRHLARYAVLGGSRIVKIYGGIDTDHFRPPSPAERALARQRFGLADTDFVCLLAARLAWVKGHDLLINAVRGLRATHPGTAIKCLFVGSGGREEEIRSFALKDDEDRASFHFVGFMSDVREALWAADAFVLPSRFEGFPLGVAEAMATGLVPIRTPAGGASDQIIHGETGLMIAFEDVDGLSGAIQSLMDPDRRDAMGRRGAERAVSLFGVPAMVDRMLATYGMTV